VEILTYENRHGLARDSFFTQRRKAFFHAKGAKLFFTQSTQSFFSRKGRKVFFTQSTQSIVDFPLRLDERFFFSS
jgi:hypothetical protein